MPCDQIQTTEVELANPHMGLLMDALKDLGLNPTHNAQTATISFRGGYYQNGRLTIEGRYASRNSEQAASIKEAYSKRIVQHAAKQYGWNITQAKTSRKGVRATFKVTR